MSSYGMLERWLATQLSRVPKVKAATKQLYQYGNYIIYGERGFKCELQSGVKVQELTEWAGLPRSAPNVHEFFGYFDKSPWSVAGTRAIMHRWAGGDSVQLVLLNKETREQQVLGETLAWSLQQGAMLQWVPGGDDLIAYNQVINGDLGTRLLMQGKSVQEIPWPVQAFHPDGDHYLSLNYIRLFHQRPDYGYNVSVQNFSDEMPLDKDGIWQVDCCSGKARLRLSLADLINIRFRDDMKQAVHKVNHILFSPTGKHFVFMHRWTGQNGRYSRLYLSDWAGGGCSLLLDAGMISHYAWKDDRHLLAWAEGEAGNRYYEIDVQSGEKKNVGQGRLDQFGDGHPSYSPDGRWVLTDSYPDRARKQHLMLFDTTNLRLFDAGQFLSPLRYNGEGRCDLHPRWHPDGATVSIDSAMTGSRRTYALNVAEIVSTI